MLFHEIPWYISEVPAQSYIEPVTIDELKVQCRVDSDDENPWLTTAGQAARELLEIDTRRAFIQRSFLLTVDQFPYWGQLDRQSIERTSQAVGVFYGGGFLVRRCPVVSIDQFKYIDTTGTLQTLASDGSAYITDLTSEPARIYPAYGVAWPISRWQNKAIQITFTAGYGLLAASVPARAKAAIKMLVAHWFYHRESVGVVGDEVKQGYQSCVNSLRWSASPV
ncbi:MAG TPA: head-tail connector protein [Planctomycetaceae bacterium]|jgi:uncharacterized phiE125 gp8 family phage protein